MQSSTGRKVATIHVLPPSPQSDASSPAGKSTTKHKRGKKVNKRGSDNLFLWLLRRLCRHLSGAFLLHHTTLIESFPVSLDLITSFYRLLGFSFSACRYIEVQSTFGGGGGDNQIVDPLHFNNRYQFRLTVWQKSAKAVLKRYLGLLLNLFLLFLYLAPFLRIHFFENESAVRYANDTTTTSNYTAIRFEDFGHFTTTIIQGISGGGGSSNGKASSSDENSDMSQLKPILRLIMEWLMYVFMFNGFFSVAYNLLFGGALLHHLVGIGDFADLDDSRSLAVRLLGATLGAILTIKLATMSLYQSELLKLFFEDNESGQHYDPNFLAVKRPVMLVNLVAELLATTGHYLILSMISVFFLYSMIMFKRSIEALQTELLATVTANSMTGETADGSGGGPELDEHQLTVLKTRLYRLNEAFKRAVLFFSVPLTLDLIANCYMLIGSACFLIIRSNNRNIRPYAITFVANIGLFALLRLVVVASAGNLPGAAASSLLRTVYEAKAEWTLGEWLAYLDIKRAPAEFRRLCLFGVHSAAVEHSHHLRLQPQLHCHSPADGVVQQRDGGSKWHGKQQCTVKVIDSLPTTNRNNNLTP
ncbi:hypothetical protein TYRP_011129 [Tyrophagus putrescentiae]|nr:hypothetical protein TYRP_011129 [Tyrophagus putrescentiae]